MRIKLKTEFNQILRNMKITCTKIITLPNDSHSWEYSRKFPCGISWSRIPRNLLITSRESTYAPVLRRNVRRRTRRTTATGCWERARHRPPSPQSTARPAWARGNWTGIRRPGRRRSEGPRTATVGLRTPGPCVQPRRSARQTPWRSPGVRRSDRLVAAHRGPSEHLESPRSCRAHDGHTRLAGAAVRPDGARWTAVCPRGEPFEKDRPRVHAVWFFPRLGLKDHSSRLPAVMSLCFSVRKITRCIFPFSRFIFLFVKIDYTLRPFETKPSKNAITPSVQAQIG